MFPVMDERRPATTLGAIEEFERSRNLILPPLYKKFLLFSNGGRPEAPLFPIRNMPLNPDGVIQLFYGIDPSDENYDLVRHYDFFYERGIPKSVIFIATTGTAEKIALDLRLSKEEVVLWNFRHHWGTGEWRESDLYHVADSFDEFLRSLRPNPY